MAKVADLVFYEIAVGDKRVLLCRTQCFQICRLVGVEEILRDQVVEIENVV